MTAREHIHETEKFLDDLDRTSVLWGDPDDELDEMVALWDDRDDGPARVKLLEEDDDEA